MFGICVGYSEADNLTAIKPRSCTNDLTVQDAIAHNNEVMQAFYREQQMNLARSKYLV